MNKQVHVFYSGKVQGVGFRFTVEAIARQAGVLGWVKNLRDGRVEVVAQAQEEALEDFLAQIKERFSSYIRDIDAEYSDTNDDFSDFSIRF